MGNMDIWQAVLLGVVQGITEWLPVSSSGHLVLFQSFLADPPLLFDVMLHLGTLLVILIFLKSDIVRIISGAWCEAREKGLSWKSLKNEENLRTIFLVLVGTVPTGIIGLILNKYFVDAIFSSLWTVSICLMITGTFLLFAKEKGEKKTHQLTVGEVLLIGTFQGLAILPGISRSGITITAGLLFYMKSREAGTFSFLLFIPAVLGAVVLRFGDVTAFSTQGLLLPALAGTATSVVVGYASLWLLYRILDRDRLRLFAPYCLLVGFMVLLLLTF